MRGALKMSSIPQVWDDGGADGQFEAALASIHGIGGAPEDLAMGIGVDTRQAELQAMFDAYLGRDFDREKVWQVLDLQNSLHSLQSRLQDEYEHRRLSASEYVSGVNDAIHITFEACEQVLGQRNFERLFSCTLDEVGGYIDLDDFLLAEQSGDQPYM